MTVGHLHPYGAQVTGRNRHRLAASVALVALGAACGGGPQHQVAAQPRALPTITSVAPSVAPPLPASASAITPHPRSNAPIDRTPAPVIVDRGTDHVAIADSLIKYGRWLEWHHPDAALVPRAYARGSKLARTISADVAQMIRAQVRITEVDSAPMRYVVLSRLPNVVSFRQTEQLERRDLVDVRGRVVQHFGAATEHYIVSIMRFGPNSPWRLNDVDYQRPPVEVQLTSAPGPHGPRGDGELRGGRFRVGVEVPQASGPVTTDSGSRSLPRLVHYVSTPLAPGQPGGLGNVCNAGDSGADPPEIIFGWLYDVVAYTNDGRIISDTHECVPFPDTTNQSQPPPAPPLPDPPTIGDVWRAVALPRPIVGANPVSRGVTGLETRMWSGGAQTAVVAVTLGDIRVNGTARVVGYRFATDEGYLGSSAVAGDPSNPVAAHRFTTKGAHSLSVSTVWQATVNMTGVGGTVSIPLDINTAVLTVTVAYPVSEVRSRLVG
jgi:hypothetical protein